MIPPYRYERPHDPPPPPELIDALADQVVIAALRQAPGTVHQVAERTAITEMSLYAILRRLAAAGHIVCQGGDRGRKIARQYSLPQVQPCP